MSQSENSAGNNTSEPSAITEALTGVMPYITVSDSSAALDFYKRAFGARELPGRLTAPDGTVMHAMFSIGDATIMIADEHLQGDKPMHSPAPPTLGGTTFKLNLYVEDAQAVFDQAVAAGATPLIPVAEQFYGHLSGRVVDPFGHVWIVSTEIEKLDPAEMQRRFQALFG